MQKIVSIVIMSLSILILFVQPFGVGVVIDDHYRLAPWQDMVYLFTLLFGIFMYPTEYVQNSSSSEEST